MPKDLPNPQATESKTWPSPLAADSAPGRSTPQRRAMLTFLAYQRINATPARDGPQGHWSEGGIDFPGGRRTQGDVAPQYLRRPLLRAPPVRIRRNERQATP